jgi:HSP90 family molecular chaperone
LLDFRSIAEQLYSSKDRFLYELIQNADDSMYNKANRSGTNPSLAFNITPTCFIIETNEDGFTRANVKAICATGKSSKKASELDDHIGEKGFGFKSVFAVAKKVHIQSGVWSFCFEHSQGQDGLGMVTPLDASPTPLAENITTRITLMLADNGHAAYEKLVNAIEDLPNTVIFFLQKLENLTIRIEQSDGRIESTMIRKTREPTLQIVHLSREKQCFQGSNEKLSSLTERSDYHVVTHMIEKMPEDERRTGRHTAFVQLAFPVDAVTQEPKLSRIGQHVFAYLPLQRLSQLNVSR